MDIKYNVGQEVYVMYQDLLTEVDLGLGCSEDVQELLKEIANMTVKKVKIESIHIYGGDKVRYKTAARTALCAEDIGLSAEEVRNSAIKKLRDVYIYTTTD